MIGELLYGLTPRDDASLLLEVRDLFITGGVLGNPDQLASFVFSPGEIPGGRVAIPLSCGVEIISSSNANSVTSMTLGSAGRGPQAARFGEIGREIAASSLAGTERQTVSLRISDQHIICPNESIFLTVGMSSVQGAGTSITLNANLRILLIPRGTLGI